MGTIKGKFLTGTVGNNVFREYRGAQLIQSAPRVSKSHRTEGTKKAAKIFGKASKLASGLRWSLAHVSRKFYDGTMIYRLNTEVLRCLNAASDPESSEFNFNATSFRTLAGFEFNMGSMVKNNFFVQPIVSIEGTTLKVHIPEINIPNDIKWPIERPKSCKLMLVNGLIDLNNSRTRFDSPQVMDIPYSFDSSKVAGQTFEFEVIPGCLCVTAISLQYTENTFLGENTVNSKTFNPAAILNAHIAEGTVDPTNQELSHRFD